jgi:riboflavin synthase alpha subunit
LRTRLTLEQGEVTLNGESMTVEELMNKGQAAARGGVSTDLPRTLDSDAY